MTKATKTDFSSLSQKRMAELIGKPPVWLRDNATPRNEDGTYDARVVVRWFVDWQLERAEHDDLKAEKLQEEINVLKERNKKLQFENQTTAGHMADVRNLRDMLAGLSVPMRTLGELFGRKRTITGRDAQQMLNKSIEDYERLLRAGLPEQ